MRLPRFVFRRPAVPRVALGVLVLAASLLAVIATSYRAPLYGDGATIVVLDVGERTAEGMAVHERRLASAESLRRAALDSRLAGLARPLRAGDPLKAIGSAAVPTVYVSVSSVTDGTLRIDSVSEESAEEARSIALAVADAYIGDLGADRIARVADSIPTACEFQWGPIGDRRGAVQAVFLGILAAGFVLFVPTSWFSRRRLAVALVLSPAAAVVLMEELWSSRFFGGESVDVAAAAVLLSAFALGAMRRPWAFLGLALAIWAFAPVMHDGFTAMTLFARASAAAWAIGACAGGVSRLFRRWRGSASAAAPI